MAAAQPFHVDVVVGLDAESFGVEVLPLEQLYFCDGCSRVVSRRDLAEEVESYFCPNCLETVHTSEAMLYGMRCSKCWECPVCQSTLSMITAPASGEAAGQVYYWACPHCMWTSRGELEATKLDQLIAKIVGLEKESISKKTMGGLVDALRKRAQEYQREKEFEQRWRRKPSLKVAGSWFGGSLSGLIAPGKSRYMSGLPKGGQQQGRDLLGPGKPPGPWQLDDLDAKLRHHEAQQEYLRAEDCPETAAAKPLSVPIAKAYTVEELLQGHLAANREPEHQRLLTTMQQSLAEVEGCTSLQQRLGQVIHGYHGIQDERESLAHGHVQMHEPCRSLTLSQLRPVGKVLLTKHSRVCRLPKRGTTDTNEPDGELPPSTKGDAQPAVPPCGVHVIRPQMSAVKSEHFQKNNIALAFIPQCRPWSWWREQHASETPAVLLGDETAELIFAFVNPLTSEMSVSFEPQAFNKQQLPEAGAPWPMSEQNMEVLSPAFETTLAARNLEEEKDEEKVGGGAESVSAGLGEGVGCILKRKKNRILLRLQFRGLEPQAAACRGRAWVFFCRVQLRFSAKPNVMSDKVAETPAAEHSLTVVLRFGLRQPRAVLAMRQSKPSAAISRMSEPPKTQS